MPSRETSEEVTAAIKAVGPWGQRWKEVRRSIWEGRAEKYLIKGWVVQRRRPGFGW